MIIWKVLDGTGFGASAGLGAGLGVKEVFACGTGFGGIGLGAVT